MGLLFDACVHDLYQGLYSGLAAEFYAKHRQSQW